MKKMLPLLSMLVMACLATSVAMAANSDTCTINYEVQAINEVNIDDASVTLTVSSATAGSAPDQASASTTYDITTNCADNAKKITGAIDTTMPDGLTLQATVSEPTGAVGLGAKTITDVATDLVSGVDAVAESNLNLGFTLDATVAAGVVASASKTFTMTLVDAT